MGVAAPVQTTMMMKMVPVPVPAGTVVGLGGSSTTTTTTSAPFDCNAGFSNWAAGWSAPKKAWCCAHFGLDLHGLKKGGDGTEGHHQLGESALTCLKRGATS